MKPRHWIACYVTAALLAWCIGTLIGKAVVYVVVRQIDRCFDELHTQLQTTQSNIIQEIRNQPPVVLPNPWQPGIIITNQWLTNSIINVSNIWTPKTILMTNWSEGNWTLEFTNGPRGPAAAIRILNGEIVERREVKP